MTNRLRILVTVLCGSAIAGGATWADQTRTIEPIQTQMQIPSVSRLLEAARLTDLMTVVATEGARHGEGLEASLFPGKGGPGWNSEVAAIQSPERLTSILETVLAKELGEGALKAALSFYDSELGRAVSSHEVQARRAMLDGAVEAGAIEASAVLKRDGADRALLVQELMDTLDLVAANVSGGLNANYAFYRGLGDGGAMRKTLTESEMLAMVWGQEAEVREATSRWLRGYLTMAYTPLDDSQLRAYITWAGTADGRKLNAALFAAFGQVFEATSYELGLAAARRMTMTDA